MRTILRRGKGYMVLWILLTGCVAPRSYVSFEILEPGNVTFPVSVEKVAYLNRSPQAGASFDEATLRRNDHDEIYILDTIIINNLVRGVTEELENSTLEYLEEPVMLASRRRDTVNMASELPPDRVRGICDRFGIDALISQEYYSMQLGKSVRFNWAIQQQEEVYALLQEVMWRVYLPDSTAPLDEFRIIDTLYYVNYAEDPPEMHYSATDIIREGYYSAGQIFGRHLVPIWIEISRPVYRGREALLKQAAAHTDKGEWERAKELWQQGLKSDNPDLAGKSAHNLAVYYELEDDLEQAQRMAEIAVNTWEGSESKWYLADLQVRVLNKQDVQKQFH